MKKIIRLTESDLVRIVKRVINETEENISDDGKFVSCGKIGVKHMGMCEKKTKRPVEKCAKFGIKSPGYCYVDTQKVVPNK